MLEKFVREAAQVVSVETVVIPESVLIANAGLAENMINQPFAIPNSRTVKQTAAGITQRCCDCKGFLSKYQLPRLKTIVWTSARTMSRIASGQSRGPQYAWKGVPARCCRSGVCSINISMIAKPLTMLTPSSMVRNRRDVSCWHAISNCFAASKLIPIDVMMNHFGGISELDVTWHELNQEPVETTNRFSQVLPSRWFSVPQELDLLE